MKIRRLIRFATHVAICVGALYLPWLIGAARAAVGSTVVPPPTPDAIASYLTSYGWIVGIVTVAYIVAGYLLRAYAKSSWLAQGKRLAWATALVGLVGTGLQAYVSGTPLSGVLVTAVLGVIHIADAQVTPAVKS